MILLTRLGGHEMAVNPDLIERAEATPDTVITMTDGHKLVVAESLTELVARVRELARRRGRRGARAAPARPTRLAPPPTACRQCTEVVRSAGLDTASRGQVVPLRGREG